MIYYVLSKRVEINSMQKPGGFCAGVYQFEGGKNLQQIGLNETFFYHASGKFSTTTPEDADMKRAQTDELKVLSLFLTKCIEHRQLVSQYADKFYSS